MYKRLIIIFLTIIMVITTGCSGVEGEDLNTGFSSSPTAETTASTTDNASASVTPGNSSTVGSTIIETLPQNTQASTRKNNASSVPDKNPTEKPTKNQTSDNPVKPVVNSKIAAPDNIKLLGWSNGEGVFSWSGGSGKYQVRISQDGRNYSNCGGITKDRFIAVQNIKANKEYTIRVYSVTDDNKVSDKYSSLKFKYSSKDVEEEESRPMSIQAPSNLCVSNIGIEETTISWTGGTGEYRIMISEDGSDFYTYKFLLESKELKLTGLSANTKYSVRVYSVGNGFELSKEYASLTFNTKALPTPKNLKISYVSPHGAILNWSDGGEYFLVKTSTDGKKFVDYGYVTSGKTQELLELKASTKYWVRVYTTNFYEMGPYVEATFTTGKVSLAKQSSTFTTYRSSNNDKDYFQIRLLSNSIEIKGSTLTDSKWIWVQVMSGSKAVEDEIFQVVDGAFFKEINTNLQDGKYEIRMLQGKERYGFYNELCIVDMTNSNGTMFFRSSPVYGTNYARYTKGFYFSQDSIETGLNSTDHKRIKDLALDITNGVSGDYNKVFAISEWVAENIYYNYDGFYSGNYGKTDAIGTLNNKRSVCQGYAELTAALIKSINIPCKVVSGYGMGIGTNGDWSKVGTDETNHAWNEAYVDGRWVIIDTTWNSLNKYENGKFVYGGSYNRYFDPTLEAFSYDHMIVWS